MPDTRRITMRQLKDVLSLKLESHHSHQRIAQMLGLSKGVVTKYVKLAAAAGLTWQQIQDKPPRSILTTARFACAT